MAVKLLCFSLALRSASFSAAAASFLTRSASAFAAAAAFAAVSFSASLGLVGLLLGRLLRLRGEIEIVLLRGCGLSLDLGCAFFFEPLGSRLLRPLILNSANGGLQGLFSRA
jgi:hypothetical protein